MSSALPLLLLFTQVSSSSVTAGLGDRPFSVEADRLEAEPERGLFRAEGSVVVRRPGATLWADVVTFDEAAQVAVAEGDVTAVEGASVLHCRRVVMKVPELLGGIEQAELRIKTGLDPRLVATASTPADLAAVPDELIVEAERLVRRSARTFVVENGSFTACDCGEDSAPTWRIRSSSAAIDLDSGAWLRWPIFYVKDVPILALPIYYVPLGPRRTGLLTPRFSNSPVTGFEVSQPLYLVFGPSWDATVAPAYLSTRGPGLELELRYAPSLSTSGAWSVTGLLDFGDPRQDQTGAYSKTREDPLARFGVTGRHVTDFGEARFHTEVNFLGDPQFVSDFADAFLSRQQEMSRSRATVTTNVESIRIAAAVQWLQDLRGVTYAPPAVGLDGLRSTSLLSSDVPGPGAVRQRVFELRMDAAPYPLTSAFPLIGDAGFSLQLFGAPSASVARFARADFRPEVRVPFDLFGVVLEPFVAGRVTVWAGNDDDRSVAANREALIAGGRLFVDLVRGYQTVFHRVRPSLEYVAVPAISRRGDDVFSTFDEIDLLERVSQARARIFTEWLRLSNGQRLASLDVWFGGDLGLPGTGSAGASEIVAEPYLSLAPGGWPVRFDLFGLAAYDPVRKTLTEVLAGVAARASLGSLAVSFSELAGGAPPRHTFVAPEELVPSDTIDRLAYVSLSDYGMATREEQRELVPWSPFRGVSLAATVRPFEPLSIGFEMVLSFLDEQNVYRPTGDPPSVVRGTRTVVRWDSPCDCLSAYVTASTARDREGFSWDFGLDLARLGGVSSR